VGERERERERREREARDNRLHSPFERKVDLASRVVAASTPRSGFRVWSLSSQPSRLDCQVVRLGPLQRMETASRVVARGFASSGVCERERARDRDSSHVSPRRYARWKLG